MLVNILFSSGMSTVEDVGINVRGGRKERGDRGHSDECKGGTGWELDLEQSGRTTFGTESRG